MVTGMFLPRMAVTADLRKFVTRNYGKSGLLITVHTAITAKPGDENKKDRLGSPYPVINPL